MSDVFLELYGDRGADVAARLGVSVNDRRSRSLTKQIASWPKEKQDEEMMRQMRQADVRFGILDSDKNAKMTRPEYEYTGWLMCQVHDTNEDGFVSKDGPVKENPESADADKKDSKKAKKS